MPQSKMTNGRRAATISQQKNDNIGRCPSSHRDNRTAAAEKFPHLAGGVEF
jgi:hypothetical protein